MKVNRKKSKNHKDFIAVCVKCKIPVAGSSGNMKFMIEGLPCPYCGSSTVVEELII